MRWEGYDYVLSGSLLGDKLRSVRSLPVGSVRIVDRYPLDFEEFCWANGDDAKAEADDGIAEVKVPNIPYEEMSVEQLQAVILAKMAKNDPRYPAPHHCSYHMRFSLMSTLCIKHGLLP